MSPETWRVVFSSTGDLAPAGTAAHADKPTSRQSILLARLATAAVHSAVDAVEPIRIYAGCRICSAPLLRLPSIQVCERCTHWLEAYELMPCSMRQQAFAFPLPETGPAGEQFGRTLPSSGFTLPARYEQEAFALTGATAK